MKPKKPVTALDQPGRQRVANLMAIYNVSHATIHRWRKTGELPPPDLYVGRTPLWNNSTIKAHLESNLASKQPSELK